MTIEQKPVENALPTGAKDAPSPNDNYKDNPLLDENGNPKEQVTPAPKDDDASNKDTTPKPNEDVTPKPEQPTVDWTNLSNLQKLEKFLAEATLKPTDVAKAVAENEGKVTPEILKALEDKHGVGVAALLADQIAQVHKQSVEHVKARDAAAFKVLEAEFADITQQSGEETFNELKTWAMENVPKEERAELDTMLQKGGLSAQLALKHLATQFKATANVTVPAGLVGGDRTSDRSDFVPISKAEYTTKLRELEKKGHVYGQSQEMAKLDRQRSAGIQRGI